MNIFTTRYQTIDSRLKKLIKYYWFLESDSPIALYHKLLPVNNMDIIINLSGPIKYIKNNKYIDSERIHINGIRDKHCFISQRGKIAVMGISFFSYGIYPFLKVPASEFTNQTLCLNEINNNFVDNIELKLSQKLSISEYINIIEDELLKTIDFNLIDIGTLELFQAFYSENNINIKNFCQKYGGNIKKLERIFLKYVGMTPKSLQCINRFQDISNQLINSNSSINLTNLAQEYNYYDQTHFINEFKNFSGCTPTQFLKERSTIKDITKHLPIR